MIEHWNNISLEDIDGEIWKDIIGYENIFQISNCQLLLSKDGSFRGDAQRKS